MYRNKLACSVLVLAVAGSMWACGSDDDSTGGGGTGGTAGSHAGSGGRAGSAGAAHAGTSGAAHAGAGNGGAGTGGGAHAGTGGGAHAGTPGMAGEGGDGPGPGGSGGDLNEGGMGGEAGAPSAPTLAESCAAVCAAEAGLSCSLAGLCQSNCMTLGTDPVNGTDQPDLYATMMTCQGQSLTASNYYCSDQGPIIQPAPKADGPCKAKVCAWTCADMVGAADANVAADCGC